MSSLWIINKAGGLIYQAEYFQYPKDVNLSSNDYLVLAGTLHGIHAIASRITPAPGKESQGLEVLEADNLLIRVKMTATGTKLVPPVDTLPLTRLAAMYICSEWL